MKKVCLFNYSPIKSFHGYTIETFDPLSYFKKESHWSLFDLLAWGRNGYDHRRAITASSAWVDRLYRERNPNYMRMVNDFIDRFRNFDLIVMSTYNFVHPELLERNLKKPVKILGFIDDPVSTYHSGISYLWAFDGAFYISPSYIDDLNFQKAIQRWSDKPSTWWPLVPNSFNRPKKPDDTFFRQRTIEIVYVGNPNASKTDRLIKLKKYFGNRFRVHGRWPFKGYQGIVRGLLGKQIYPHRVTALATNERTQLYWNTKIGFNMHYSERPSETGNMRMYETPAHGMLMICDKSANNEHEKIFKSNKEAVYYDTIKDAIDIIKYYLDHDDERLEIAKGGFYKFWKSYEWEKNLLKFLNWAINVRNKK